MMGVNLRRFVGSPESNYICNTKPSKQELLNLERNSYQIPGKQIGKNLYKRNMKIINEYINITK